MEVLSITLEELKRYANSFRVQNQKLTQELNQIHRIMNELSTIWSSPAQLAYVSRFKKLLPIFDDYAKVVDNYALYLDSTYDSYQMLESKMKNGANTVSS